VNLGSRLYISKQVTGVLLVPEGLPTIHTLQPGQTATVSRLITELDLIEIDAGGQRMLFSVDSLKRRAEMFSAA
jgi:hypothetical protein